MSSALVTAADDLPRIRTQDGKRGDAIARVKLFFPAGRYTLFVTEWDGDDALYGFCVSPLGADCDELGYASLSELRDLVALGLKVERDVHYTPKPLREALADHYSSIGEPIPRAADWLTGVTRDG